MLILSRKKDEAIIINHDISIIIVAIQGDKVRIGIDAPKHVSVHRKEVWLTIQSRSQDLSKEQSDESD